MITYRQTTCNIEISVEYTFGLEVEARRFILQVIDQLKSNLDAGKMGNTSEHNAIRLVKFGIRDINVSSDVDGRPLNTEASKSETVSKMNRCVLSNDMKAVIRLICDGYDVNQIDYMGRTALHYAAYDGNLAMVTVLLSLGSDRSLQDNDGKTAKDFAHQQTHDMVAQILS